MLFIFTKVEFGSTRADVTLKGWVYSYSLSVKYNARLPHIVYEPVFESGCATKLDLS